MLTAFMVVNTMAQTWNCGYPNAADVKATLSGGTLTISGKGAMIDYSSYRVPPWKDVTKAVIEDGVTTIGEWTFSNCPVLTSATIGNSVMSIGKGAFYDCNGLTAIDVVAGNASFSSQDGVLFNKGKTTLILYPIGKPGSSYTVPNSVTSIGESAFFFSRLTSVTIPNGTIGNGAFQACDCLTSVTIGNGVTSIGNMAFVKCWKLTSVTIGSGVTSIGSMAFDACESLTSITCLKPNPATITMGNQVFGDDMYSYSMNKNNCLLKVPAGAVSLYKKAPQWKSFQKIMDGGANLKSLTVNAGTLNPAFNSSIFMYRDTVPQNVGNIVLKTTPTTGATVSGDGQKTLNFGENTFEIKVTTAQGTSVYTVIVIRTVDTYLLTDLTVSAGALSPEFKPDTFVYKAIVPVSVENVVLKATPITGATVSGDGKKALKMGENTFEIKVVSPTLGSFVYTVTITRAESDILFQLINIDETTSGNTTTTYSGWKFTLIDGYKLNYQLTTGNVSGDFPLHFDVRDGLITHDTIINVKAYSVYNITLNLTGITYSQSSDLWFTKTYYNGVLVNIIMIYTRHAGNVIASNDRDTLSTTEINFVGSGIKNVSVSDLTFVKGYGNPTSVKEVSAAPAVAVFPNPATEFITIQGAAGSLITVSDLSGRTVYKQAMTGESETIAVSSWANGVYLVAVQTGNNKTVSKIVKK